MCFLPIDVEKGLPLIRSYDFTINERTIMYRVHGGRNFLHFYSALRCQREQKIYLIKAVLGIRIRMVLGLPDPDLLVRGADPDPDPSLYS